MSAREIEAALRLLEKVARERGDPSHYLARHVLLALGALLRAGAPDARAWVERVRAVAGPVEPAWRQAVETELTLACGELVQSVDPRFVQLPGYDLDYTRRCHARLEERLAAARELGFALQPREAEMLALAERVLADVEAARAGRPADRGPAPR